MLMARNHRGTWNRIIDASKYRNVLGYYIVPSRVDGLNIGMPVIRKGRIRLGSWRRITDLVLGEFEYDAVLEGFG